MGMGHMKQVWALWAELPDRPFRVLLYMAMVIPDAETEPRWYGSADQLAVAAGMGADVDGPKRKTVINKVGIAVKALVDAGALEVIHRAAPGRRAVYGLCVSMEQSRYTRERSNNGRLLNVPDETSPTFPTKPVQRSRRNRDPMSKKDEVRTRTGGTTSRNQLPVGERALRAIDGGRDPDAHDATPVQLPFLAVVPVPPSEDDLPETTMKGLRDAR